MIRPRAGVPARRLVGAVVAALVLVPAAAHARVGGQSAGGAVEIEIGDGSFSPKVAVIAPGTMVRWTNVGEDRHSVTPDAGSQFGIATLEPGESYEFTFEEAGRFGYFCSFHGAPGTGEFGTVRVMGRATEPEGTDVSASGTGTTIRVPQDVPTIQRAVDRSTPGSLVLVAPGVYEESVVVGPKHPDIVIRGIDRDRTVLDGRFDTEPGSESAIKVLADGVAIENMTARNYVGNGFVWIRANGYRGSYLSAVRNGEYGLYAFDSVHGQFDHSYASGSADAGFYIGHCDPCDALIVDSEAEWNGLGYSGTNAGGDVVLARSNWHDNRVGIAPNTGPSDRPPPDSGTTIVGNRVQDNANAAAPAVELAATMFGDGILLAGSSGNVVGRNLVTGHPRFGIGVIPLPGPEGQEGFDARDNTVRDNVLFANGFGLASFATFDDALDSGGNCFSGNGAGPFAPENLQLVLSCDGAGVGYIAPLELLASVFLQASAPLVDFRTVALPDPPSGEGMPRPRVARPRPATNEPSTRIRLAKVAVPTG